MPPLQKIRRGREPFSLPKARQGLLSPLSPLGARGSELSCGHDGGRPDAVPGGRGGRGRGESRESRRRRRR